MLVPFAFIYSTTFISQIQYVKVHIANLAGKDKISFDERAQFTEENIDLIRDSVENPLGGERWWMSCDDPFQALAACIEVVNAIDSGDPQNYECSLPVSIYFNKLLLSQK